MEKEIKSNKVEIFGKITEKFEFSHELYGENFYKSFIACKRTSGTYDRIPFIISDRVSKINELEEKEVLIRGEFRSHNTHDETGKRHLSLSVFVRECEEIFGYDKNKIVLDGTICTQVTHRITHAGREISDFVLAVNRPFGKSDYLPCIAWGRNSRYVALLDVGTKISCAGRIQSREYEKKLQDGSCEARTAYEVSLSRIEVKDEVME